MVNKLALVVGAGVLLLAQLDAAAQYFDAIFAASSFALSGIANESEKLNW